MVPGYMEQGTQAHLQLMPDHRRIEASPSDLLEVLLRPGWGQGTPDRLPWSG